jgi:hypothetical protein
MAVTKRYTDQIVVMQTPAMGAAIRKLADELGLSVAQVARDAQSLGMQRLREHYRNQGVTAPHREPPARRERKSAKSGTGEIPAAQFVAPGTAA